MPYKARGGRGVGNLAQNERKHKMVLDFPSLILNVVPPPFFLNYTVLKVLKFQPLVSAEGEGSCILFTFGSLTSTNGSVGVGWMQESLAYLSFCSSNPSNLLSFFCVG